MDVAITLDKSRYFPGEVVKCFVRVTGAGPSAVSSTRLSVECGGTERTDPGWISNLYRKEAAASKDGRRLVRTIFQSSPNALMDDRDEPAGFQRGFTIRFQLPNRIPPTYKGSSIRFHYQVQAKGSCSIAGRTVPVEAAAPFTVWPLADRSLERRHSLQSSSAQEAAQEEHQAQAQPQPQQQQQQQQQQDGLDVIEYRLEVTGTKCKWEEVPLNQDGTVAAGSSTLSQPLSPAASSALLGTAMSGAFARAAAAPFDGAASTASSSAAAAGPSALEEEGVEEPHASSAAARHLTPLQRSSMAVKTFNLRAGDHPLVRITLQPPLDSLVQPGATLGVLLDFQSAHGAQVQGPIQPKCLQVVVLLESLEIIHAPYRHAKASPEASQGMRKLYCEQQEVTADLQACSFLFSIPPNAPPSFHTPMVSHRWVLRFELTLAMPKAGGRVVTEQLIWMLPIAVFPLPNFAL